MAGESFEEDLEVLKHLRGYPDEVKTFGNTVKQANPRGMSAVRLVLGRPVSTTSLIAAVCRYVADGVPVASAVEVAERLGLPPRRFLDEVAARPDFPAPLFANEHRRLWRLADIDAYIASHPPA
jgi:hypothetical protein